MKLIFKNSSWYLLLTVCILWSCDLDKDDDVPQPDTNEYFVSATSVGTFPKEALQALALASPEYRDFTPLVQYDVSFYRILYNTTYNIKGGK